jgi:hypothetical protein
MIHRRGRRGFRGGRQGSARPKGKKMADVANYIFLPWVQPGVAANIPDQAVEKLDPAQPAAVALPIKLLVNTDTIEKTVRLYGPGDITGIDPQQVVRLEPKPRTSDFEPNFFPAIEFDRPDFPWLFSPAKADTQGQLRPWLCLVVVRKQEGVEIRPAERLPLPILEIKPPAKPGNELPDLAESHFWAHAQLTGIDKSRLPDALASEPQRSVSRLVCPRRLEAETDYVACVVPAFEVGRKSALNLPVESNETLLPAWNSGGAAPKDITLPVYYLWEFRTSEDGDFEELVRKLEPRVLPPEVGKLPMDISRPGFKIEGEPMTGAPETVLSIEGALRVVDSKPDDWPDEKRAPFQNALSTIVNTPWELATKPGATQDPIVAPPVYGCWHAGVHEVHPPAAETPPPAWPPPFWLDELNLDPRNRVVAGMGTRVVQDQQEPLMASAWEQLGEIEKINQRLRQAQLSRAVNDKYIVRNFSRFSVEAFVKIVAPAQSRVVLEETTDPNQPPVKMLLTQKLAGTFVPQTAVSPSMRKMTRPRGALNREFLAVGEPGVQKIFAFFNGAGARDSISNLGRGVVTIDQVSDTFPASSPAHPGFVWVPVPVGHWERVRANFIDMHNNFRLGSITADSLKNKPVPPVPAAQFRDAAIAHQEPLSRAFSPIFTVVFHEFRRTINTEDIKTATLSSLNPAKTVSQAVQNSIKVTSPQGAAGDELAPVMDAPVFPQPMYEALRDVSQDYLFPGLEYVPPNTVQLLQTNAKFIESFMVGLNAEMARELLWRDYPTDQRGTYFRQFWDTVSADAEPQFDITPIHEWDNRALGTTAVWKGGDKLVLLIRGDLLRRYPNTVIYAVKAVVNDGKREPSTDPAAESHPAFRGTLQPDVTFLGFELTPKQVLEGDGYFFVLQQQPTEPRFGMDDDPFSEGETGEIPDLKTWDDLNWAHVAPSAAELKALSHAPVKSLALKPTELTKGTWGRNSAHMAYITKQRLVRIAIHASELLPPLPKPENGNPVPR